MKILFLALTLLSSASVLAKETTIRLTNSNISSIKVSLAACGDGASLKWEPAKVLVMLKNGKTLSFIHDSDLTNCNAALEQTTENARNMAQDIQSIQLADINSYRIGNNVVCQKLVGDAVYDTDNMSAFNFKTKEITVACPN